MPTDSPPADPAATPILGKPLAEAVRERVRERVAAVAVRPTLAVVVASTDPAVAKYAEAKGRGAEKLGIALEIAIVEPEAGQGALEDRIDALSADPDIHGILLELPVDKRLDAESAIRRIDPAKDVDGLTPINLGLIAAGREADALAPATPLACLALAESVTPIAGKRAVVIGRGRSVGRALAPMLVNRDATVTICHTKTPDLAEAIAPAELVFVAAGKAGLIGPAHLKPGQVVIDAGINVIDGGIVGDVDPAAGGVVAALTPVPGGVGPLTSALIFDTLMRALDLQGSGGAA
ncbi:MAG: bifunctional 5,10-methylenetetrahydrofolate dehydrogenase/5,10-methenyltetrahydrofolate cyclohydrolase [Azospirillaceae bacterium]